MMATIAAAWRERPSFRRAAFVAGNVAAFAACIVFVILPIRDVFAERDGRIAEQRVLLARFGALASQEGRVQAVARESAAEPDRGEFLLGPNEGVIGADLQTRLKSLAETAGARLRSVQALPPKTRDDVRYLGARLEIQGPLRAVHQTVHAVETGKPYLFVAAAVVKTVDRGGGPQEPTIDAQLDIFAAVQIRERQQ
jgi:general secretion pathway protein M